MRRRPAHLSGDLLLAALLIGLAVLAFGGFFYPAIGACAALLNLIFVLALAVARLIARRARPGTE